jgi:hypothetical protein
MADDEPIAATHKVAQLLGVKMAEAVFHHDGGRLRDDQIDRVFELCLAVLTNVDSPVLISADLSLHTGAIKRAAWEHLQHLRGPHGTA